MAAQPASSGLQYAPRPTGAARVKRHLPGAVVLAVLASAYWWAPPLYRQANVLAEQRRMMAFQAPPQTVVLTSDDAEARRLLARTHYKRVGVDYMGSGSYFDHRHIAGYAPSAASPLESNRKALAGYRHALPVAFLHGRRTPSGTSRLVYVTVELAWGSVDRPMRFVRNPLNLPYKRDPAETIGTFWKLRLAARVYRPAGLEPGSVRHRILTEDSRGDATAEYWDFAQNHALLVPHRVVPGNATPDEMKLEPGPLRLLTGRPDADDPSKLSIDYECDGEKGTLVGTLGDDDVVRWKNETGPLAPWPPRDPVATP